MLNNKKYQINLPWRQFNKYCYKCGVNLHHNSITCKKRSTGHKNDATFDNKWEDLSKTMTSG